VKEGKRRRVWVLLCAIVIAIGFIGFAYAHRSVVPKVNISPIRAQTIQNTIFASGSVKAVSRQIVLSSQLPNPTFTYKVSVGESVHIGEVLLQSDATVQQASLQASEQTWTNAEQNVRLAQQAVAQSSAVNQLQAQANLANANSALVAASAQVHEAQVAVAATQIKSVLNGQVIIENTTGMAGDGTPAPILEVVGAEKYIVANVSEVDAVHLQIGMTATVTTDAYPLLKWSAKISRVAPYAVANSNGSGQVEVDLKPTGASFPIPLDYQVDLHIVSATHKAVAVIPYDALVAQGNGYSVFVYQNQHVRQVGVTIGITSDTQVEILKGVQVGALIVVNPPANLVSGMRVKTT